MASEEAELLVDLECGAAAAATTSEEEESGDSGSGCTAGRKASSRACGGASCYNGVGSGESDSESYDWVHKTCGGCCGRVELVIDKSSGDEECRDVVAVLEKRIASEPRMKPNSKKASKPPRPPKGPSLNASDLKLVKELSELAARKRARIERVKALRKMKETKRPASSSNLTAMVITVIFFIIIIFQGVFSGNHVRRELHGSPAPATASESLISIQLLNNAPASEMYQPASPSLNSLGQPSSSSPQEQEGKDDG